MQKPTKLVDRNELFKQYGFNLSTEDDSFEDMLKLATIVCNTPIAYISIIDETHQYIIHQIGLSLNTISKQNSFCQYTIQQENLLIIENAHTDPRTSNLPLVKNNPNIQFYAGYPLKDDKEQVLGSFCIMDYASKQLTNGEQIAIEIIKKQIVNALQLKRKLLEAVQVNNLDISPESLAAKKVNTLEQELIDITKRLSDQNKEIQKEQLKLQIANLKLEEQKKELALITDVLPACVSYVDTNYHYQLANSIYEEWFGFTKDELKNKPVIEVIGQSNFEASLPIYQKVFNGETVRYKKMFQFPLGAKYLRVTYIPAYNYKKEVKGIYVFAEDLTEVYNYQKELEKSNERFKNFAYHAAHDIKSPLRTIKSFGTILQKSLTNKLNKDETENLTFIINAADRLSNLTNDLLNYAKAQNTKNDFEKSNKIALSDIIDIVKQNLKSTITDSNAMIKVTANDIYLVAVKNDLIQLFQNIIGNSIKYQKENNQPIISITSQQHDTHCTLQIADNGIGISEENLDKILTPFTRLHTAQEYSGSGIGLAICQSIIEKYKSEFKINSTLDVGTTFTFNLPIAK